MEPEDTYFYTDAAAAAASVWKTFFKQWNNIPPHTLQNPPFAL